ncbi:ATP-binding cassette domain-containing protein [Pelagibius sp.]|uniref:ABC transporter ATP-binding protein n=1 Tax=Pelagibius sp. TaxID=1931238 RepID=UPI0026237C55|nr:ABC transporter ATP-binding protein [Pelagibius sp.]
MLSVRHLARPGLEPLSFDLAAGECVALRGPSGAGKSLLLRALADLDPSTGEVLLDGRERHQMAACAWRRLVGYVPAEPGWWSDRLAEHFLDWAGQAGPARRLMIPDSTAERPVRQLSTGERQRLALLRAMERGPKVLLLDEPTGPLDEEATAAVEAMLREKQGNGLAILWVTHDRRQAERIADRRFYIDRGRLREEVLA